MKAYDLRNKQNLLINEIENNEENKKDTDNYLKNLSKVVEKHGDILFKDYLLKIKEFALEYPHKTELKLDVMTLNYNDIDDPYSIELVKYLGSKFLDYGYNYDIEKHIETKKYLADLDLNTSDYKVIEYIEICFIVSW